MDTNGETSNDKKAVSKVRSLITSQPEKINREPVKRKSFNTNEAVRSLDLALCRLKKSKLVNGECKTNPGSHEASDMFMDMCSTSQQFSQGNASMLSMNFSHYEMMRNLSHSNCNSDVGVSGNTNSANEADVNVKDEQLERYFRSIELWSRNYRDGGPNNIHSDIMPDK